MALLPLVLKDQFHTIRAPSTGAQCYCFRSIWWVLDHSSGWGEQQASPFADAGLGEFSVSVKALFGPPKSQAPHGSISDQPDRDRTTLLKECISGWITAASEVDKKYPGQA